MKSLLTETGYIDPSPIRDAGHEVVLFSEAEPVPAEHRDAEGLVLWGGGGPGSADVLAEMPGYLTRLRWIQTLAAGPDNVLAAGFPSSVAITSGRHFHDRTVAEHVAALALGCMRSLPTAVRAADRHEWEPTLGGAHPVHDPERLTTLFRARVLIWGFGAIGITTAQLLTAFGASVRGVARSAGQRAGFEVISVDDIESALPWTDLLVMILPSTPQTAGALSAERLARLPRRRRERGSRYDDRPGGPGGGSALGRHQRGGPRRRRSRAPARRLDALGCSESPAHSARRRRPGGRSGGADHRQCGGRRRDAAR